MIGGFVGGYLYGLDLLLLLDPLAARRYYQTLGLSPDAVKTLTILSMAVPYFLMLAAITAVFSSLASLLYRQHAVWVACLSVLPILAVRGEELIPPASFSTGSALSAYIMSSYEIGSLILLTCIGTLLASKRYGNSDQVFSQ